MSNVWALSMLISGGLFAGGAGAIAWERLPVWRELDLADFRAAFARTLNRVDRVQPALLVACLLSTIGFALSADGAPRGSALLAAGGLLLVLVASAAWLVPAQKRLTTTDLELSPADAERLRRRWDRGHLARTLVALAALVLVAVAAVST